ncbi:GAF domain-containing protein [Haloparvum sp. PAK95]|uniref:sensor histidine kinase n=1 Tax=Haloparvum sp. PAK95 TaxID=3418962 RepID=UPI003D2EB59B
MGDHDETPLVVVAGEPSATDEVRARLKAAFDSGAVTVESDFSPVLDHVRTADVNCIVGDPKTLASDLNPVSRDGGPPAGDTEGADDVASNVDGEEGDDGDDGDASPSSLEARTRLEAIRAIDPALPILVRTEPDDAAIAMELVEAGATDSVPSGEGAHLDLLVNRVENAVSRYRTEQQSSDLPADRQLRITNEKVTAIHDFAVEMSDCDEIDEVFDRTVDAAERVLEFDRCTADRRDGDKLIPVARSSNVAPSEVRPFEIGEGVAGQTLKQQRTIVVDETREAADADPVSSSIRSAISVPIGPYGVFQATSSQPHDFGDTDVEFAELVASHAREAIARIENEQRLRTERDRLAALFENIPQPAARVRIEERDENRAATDSLKIEDQDYTAVELDAANEAYEETFGLSAEEHDPDEFQKERIPDDGKGVNVEKAADQDESIRTEVRRRTNDGVGEFRLTIIPVEGEDAQLLYAVYADIGEQKRIERTLRNLHEATREMLRATDPDEVAEISARTAIDTLGFPTSGVRLYDAEENLLKPTYLAEEATDHLDDRPAHGPGDDPIWTAFETGEPVVIPDLAAADTTLEFPGLGSLLIMPVGDHGTMSIGATEPNYFDDSDVELARVLASNVEVALDRAERSRQLRERDERLEREVERLDKFASVVSHDLRNPLSVAAGHLDFARQACENPEAVSHFDRVAEAHDRMEQLVEDVLSLAREGRTVDEMEPVSLESVAERGWRTVETEDATLEVDGAPTVEADPERLWTLLENLFRNAVEHGGDDVTITVGAVNGGFYVADDGEGMEIDPEEALSYGVSTDDDGTGFGLAIVREIAEAHGWNLTVETSDGGGTRFVFE